MTSVARESLEHAIAMAANLDAHSYYELLGVPSNASADAIRDAYYELARWIHPDRHARATTDERWAFTRLYARIGEAYRVLSLPEQRQAYDRGLASGKLRFDRESELATRPATDPRTDQGRDLYGRALALREQGDRRAARALLDLARQLEPTSRAILELLAQVQPGTTKPPSFEAASAPRRPSSTASPPMTGSSSPPPMARRPSGTTAPPMAPRPASAAPSSPASSAAERPRRKTQTLPPPAVTVRCTSLQQASALLARLRSGAVFVKSATPAALSSSVTLRIILFDERELTIETTVKATSSGERVGMELELRDELQPGVVELETLLQPSDRASDLERLLDAADRALAESRYSDARRFLTKAIELEPQHRLCRARYYLALAHEALAAGDPREARVHLQTTLIFEPENQPARIRLQSLQEA